MRGGRALSAQVCALRSKGGSLSYELDGCLCDSHINCVLNVTQLVIIGRKL